MKICSLTRPLASRNAETPRSSNVPLFDPSLVLVLEQESAAPLLRPHTIFMLANHMEAMARDARNLT